MNKLHSWHQCHILVARASAVALIFPAWAFSVLLGAPQPLLFFAKLTSGFGDKAWLSP